MQVPPVEAGVQEYRLDSWRDMLSLVEDVFIGSPAYIFRGQADWNWPIASSLHRLEQKHPRRKNPCGDNPQYFDCPPLSDGDQLAAFQRAIRGRMRPNESPQSEDEWWALGQHHGLATPLIDWTRSPFMALFFAFDEERVLHDGDTYASPADRAVFALSTSVWNDGDGGEGEALRFVSPVTGDISRLVNQQGLLLRLPRHMGLEKYVREKNPNDAMRAILIKIRIPNNDDDRHACLAMLNKMGINHMTLFPDLTGAARFVNALWEPGHEDSMPYV
jgi:FRG domain-containing protein